MDGQEMDRVLSIVAAAALLRVRPQTLSRWVAGGAFAGDQRGIALRALLELLYQQPGQVRSFERSQPVRMEHAQEQPQ